MNLDGLSRLLCEILSRLGPQSRVWLATWLAVILAITTLAVVRQAPTGAYLILVVVAVAVVAAGQSGEAS